MLSPSLWRVNSATTICQRHAVLRSHVSNRSVSLGHRPPLPAEYYGRKRFGAGASSKHPATAHALTRRGPPEATSRGGIRGAVAPRTAGIESAPVVGGSGKRVRADPD